MPEHKIKNYNSVLLIEKTIAEEGYDPTLLLEKSQKQVWVVCRYCGKPNRTRYANFCRAGYSNAHAECRKRELKEKSPVFDHQKLQAKRKQTLLSAKPTDYHIRTGMYQLIAIKNAPKTRREQLAYLIGAFLGDGSVYYGKNSYQFTITSNDYDLVSNCQIICGNLFNKSGTIKKVFNKKTKLFSYFQLRICSKKICNALMHVTSNRTTIPSIKSKGDVLYLIAGLVDSDGYIGIVNTSCYLRYRTTYKATSAFIPALIKLLNEAGVQTGELAVIPATSTDLEAYSFSINTGDYSRNCFSLIKRKQAVLDAYVESRDLPRSEMFIFIRRDAWTRFDQQTLENFKSSIYEHYRSHGFPYVTLSNSKQAQILSELCEFNTEGLRHGDYIKSHNLGLAFVNSYMPHMWNAKSGTSSFSPLENFMIDDRFWGVIENRIKYAEEISDRTIRKGLWFYSGTKGVSNFKPTTAKFIYDTYCPEGGAVYDFSCGYGGRLLGAISSSKVAKYIGVEPCRATYDGLQRIKEWTGKDVEIHNVGSEDFVPEQIDLAFSSPPYFTTEVYSSESTQSSVKFPMIEDWYEKYYFKTLSNVNGSLRDGGYLIINVANTRCVPELEAITVDFCKNLGLALVLTHKMRIGNFFQKRRGYEPIFVFQKST